MLILKKKLSFQKSFFFSKIRLKKLPKACIVISFLEFVLQIISKLKLNVSFFLGASFYSENKTLFKNFELINFNFVPFISQLTNKYLVGLQSTATHCSTHQQLHRGCTLYFPTLYFGFVHKYINGTKKLYIF